MDEYTFQLANQDEIPDIVNIYHSLVGTPGCTWDLDYPSKETAKLDVSNDWLYTLKMNDRIIAVASVGDYDELGDLQWKPENPCELMRIGVRQEFQKQGIGTILLKHIINISKEKGYDGMRFLVSKTNPAALALYDKNGFERCGEVIRYDIDFYCYQIMFDCCKEIVDGYYVVKQLNPVNPYPDITKLIKQDLQDISTKPIQKFRLIRAKSGVYVYNCLYDGNPAVVKYFEKANDRREILNYHILAQHGIPTIKVYALGKAAVVLEDITASVNWRLGIDAIISASALFFAPNLR